MAQEKHMTISDIVPLWGEVLTPTNRIHDIACCLYDTGVHKVHDRRPILQLELSILVVEGNKNSQEKGHEV